jgi:two-component system, OmpR family, sensor histidine kinase VicK
LESTKTSRYSELPSAARSDLEDKNEVTEFIKDRETATHVVLQQIARAEKEILGIGSKDALNLIFKFEPYRDAVTLAARNIELDARYISDIKESNIQACKFLLGELHVKVRHLEGIRSNFLVSEKEFSSDLSQPHPDNPTTKLLYSNSKELLAQQKQLFETLWSIAVPADQKIREIEEGKVSEETRIVSHYSEIADITNFLAASTNSEILILLPLLERIELNGAEFEIFKDKAAKNGLHVKILAPFSRDWNVNSRIMRRYPMFEIRPIEPIKIGLMISDRSRSMLVQYDDVESSVPEKAMVSGIYASQKATVASLVSIYETMWVQSETRDNEAKSRKQAELLQDILAHDIRNYNQVARLSAELLGEELKDNIPVQSIVESMLKAIDGSTNLLDRAKRLGKVLSEQNPSLYPVDLRHTILSSISLIRQSYQNKAIELTEEYPDSISTSFPVKADDLLAEVFTNLLSNCVIYTEGEGVEIELKVKDGSSLRLKLAAVGNLTTFDSTPLSSPIGNCWVISISDHGKGIHDEFKSKLFSRYLESAKGSGLGMSIVHALVVERYKGSIRVVNRVTGDYTKGTTVELCLPKA